MTVSHGRNVRTVAVSRVYQGLGVDAGKPARVARELPLSELSRQSSNRGVHADGSGSGDPPNARLAGRRDRTTGSTPDRLGALFGFQTRIGEPTLRTEDVCVGERLDGVTGAFTADRIGRSEERRVGKECRL